VAGEVILVVEPDADLRDAIVDALRDRGYSAVPAVSVSDALGMLDVLAPSLVLFDVGPQSGDATIFLDARARRRDLAGVPVIASSVAPPSGDPSLWDAYLAKPYALVTLIEAIERLI